MMMDTAWGVGAASAPTMTGCGNGSVGFPDSVTNGFTDDEIEDMIDDLGFFQDKDDNTTANAYSTNSGSGSGGWQTIKKEANVYAPAITKYATVSPAHLHLPIIRNCNDTATATATGAVVIVPNLAISTQRNCNARSTTNFPTTIASNATKDCNIALSQPPRLLTNQQSPVTSSSTAQTVLKQQQETILQNQKIIDAQRNELQGQQIHKTTCQPIAVASTPASTPASMPMPASTPNSPTTTKMSATYPLAHVALKKADEQIINGSKIAKGGTKRKVSSLSDGSPTEANAYQKWKLTPAGATKLRAVDSSGINHCRNAKQQHQEDVSGKHLNPGELEVRRYVSHDRMLIDFIVIKTNITTHCYFHSFTHSLILSFLYFYFTQRAKSQARQEKPLAKKVPNFYAGTISRDPPGRKHQASKPHRRPHCQEKGSCCYSSQVCLHPAGRASRPIARTIHRLHPLYRYHQWQRLR
jgi:hypothetical protein